MPKRVFLIDPPTPFADLEEWKTYLEELRQAVVEFGAEPDLAAAIADAEEVIAEKTK